MDFIIGEKKADIIKRHPEKAGQLDSFTAFLDAYALEYTEKHHGLAPKSADAFLSLRTHPRILTTSPAVGYYTLHLCLALHLCRPEAIQDQSNVFTLFQVVRIQLSQALLRSLNPLHKNIFDMDAVRRWFPDAADRWFEVIVDFMEKHAREIGVALASLIIDPLFLSCPKTIMSTWGEFKLNTIPPGWSLNTSTAFLSHAFSPYLAFDETRPRIQMWLDRVSPGCTSGYGWDLITSLAKCNVDSEFDYFFLSFIRGLWTRFVLIHNDPRSQEIMCGVRPHVMTGMDDNHAMICTLADAAGISASLYFRYEDLVNLAVKLRGGHTAVCPVVDFKLNTSTCGYEYIFSLGTLNTSIGMINGFMASQHSDAILRQASQWIKKLADIERESQGATRVTFDDTFQVFLVRRDERTHGAFRMMYANYARHPSTDAWRAGEDMARWKTINTKISFALDGDPSPILKEDGAKFGIDAMKPFFPGADFFNS